MTARPAAHYPIPQHKPKPITAERIENALDTLAQLMVMRGEDHPLLPQYLQLYDRLDGELQALRATGNRLAAMRERVRQSQDQKQARSS